jgi:signal transduction histidine kinase
MLPTSVPDSDINCFYEIQGLAAPITDMHRCPVAVYFAAKGFDLSLCIPLESRNQTLGAMTLLGHAKDSGSALNEETLETLAAIGRQLGVAIENACLYEEVRRREARYRQLLGRMIDLQEEERKRIARELHDRASQSLSSLLMMISVLAEAYTPLEVQILANRLRDATADVLREMRDLALELRPTILDDLGLVAALRHYAQECQDRFRLPIGFEAVGLHAKRLHPDVETALYRIAQEALTNVGRHAQAQHVSVLLERHDSTLRLIVEDDGVGFNVADVMGSQLHSGNLGLYGMEERASLIGGTAIFESAPGKGMLVMIKVPLGSEGDE